MFHVFFFHAATRKLHTRAWLTARLHQPAPARVPAAPHALSLPQSAAQGSALLEPLPVHEPAQPGPVAQGQRARAQDGTSHLRAETKQKN